MSGAAFAASANALPRSRPLRKPCRRHLRLPMMPGAIVGRECQGAYPVPVRTGQDGAKPCLDFIAGRGVSQPSGRRNDRSSDAARPGQSCGQSQVRPSDHGGATGASNHRHPAHKSASCLRSGIQPYGGLRNALRHTRVQHGSPCSYWPAFIWSWNGGRGNDERRLLRLGLQQLELQLARWRSLLPRRSVLR